MLMVGAILLPMGAGVFLALAGPGTGGSGRTMWWGPLWRRRCWP